MNTGFFSTSSRSGRPVLRLGLLGLVLLLQACSSADNMVELQNYTQSVINRPPGAIEPLPAFVSYEAFTYSAAGLRGPFDQPIDAALALRSARNNEVRPDENRPKEYLESFALSSLSMVGTMARQNEVWALIKDETNNVTRVSEGDYMGRNHGRIVGVTTGQIDLIEIVPSGDGSWLERPQSIGLTVE